MPLSRLLALLSLPLVPLSLSLAFQSPLQALLSLLLTYSGLLMAYLVSLLVPPYGSRTAERPSTSAEKAIPPS